MKINEIDMIAFIGALGLLLLVLSNKANASTTYYNQPTENTVIAQTYNNDGSMKTEYYNTYDGITTKSTYETKKSD
jgi:hypothetical protein